MKTFIDFIKRHFVWIIAGLISLVMLNPTIAEIKTLLLIVISECLAIALSGLAQFVYTKIDFIRENAVNSLGMIFIGVHLLCGLTILGVYLAQYCN